MRWRRTLTFVLVASGTLPGVAKASGASLALAAGRDTDAAFQVVRLDTTEAANLIPRTPRTIGTDDVGPTCFDSRWSSHEPYLQRMMETMAALWHRIISESKAPVPSAATVTVKFSINAKGLISKIINVDTTVQPMATRACTRAVTEGAPCGTWTDKMKADLGEQQEICVTFYYR